MAGRDNIGLLDRPDADSTHDRPQPFPGPPLPGVSAMSGRRIVLVEDDDSIRLIAQLSLETLGGHQVLALASGEEAVARAAGFRPDLLVLDVSMPGMDGPETLAALRGQASLAQVPAVFLTAHTQPGKVAEIRALGAVDVIAKPFDPQALVDRVARVPRPGGSDPEAS